MRKISVRARNHEEGIIDYRVRYDGSDYFPWRQPTDLELFSKAETSVSTVQLEVSELKSCERGTAAASREWHPEGAPTTYELLPGCFR